jgi:hypothetical protein
LSLQGVVSLSLLFHGGVGLAHVGGHARAHAKSRKLGVYDNGGVSYLSCAQRSCISSPDGGIRHGVCGVLRARFGMPSHRFLCSLLQFYGLELHHLTPSGILHMVTFVTLCKAYMGIEPHFDLWSYFFRTRLRQGSNTEAVVLGSVDLFVIRVQS